MKQMKNTMQYPFRILVVKKGDKYYTRRVYTEEQFSEAKFDCGKVIERSTSTSTLSASFGSNKSNKITYIYLNSNSHRLEDYFESLLSQYYDSLIEFNQTIKNHYEKISIQNLGCEST
jgi:hypothetical protein